MKITMNVPDDLLARVDAYAKANYQTRTSLFCFAVNQYLTAQQLPGLMKSMNEAMQRIAATGQVDQETQKALDSFEVFAKALQQP